jgi:exopolysaccharide biosynthesis polyprenyl glycosylphosphotransferase
MTSAIGLAEGAVSSRERDGTQMTSPSEVGPAPAAALPAPPGVAPARATWWPRLPISERKMLLLVGDLLLINLSLLVALHVRQPDARLDSLSPVWFIVLTGFWLLVAPAADCYKLRAAAHPRSGVSFTMRAAVVVLGAYLLTPYVTAPLLKSRAMTLVFVASVLVLLAMWRLGYASLLWQPQLRTRALVIGAGWAGQAIVQAIRAHANAAYDLVGFVDDDLAKVGTTVAGLPVLADSTGAMAVVRAARAEELIVAVMHDVGAPLHRFLSEAFEAGVRVTWMPDLYEAITARIAVQHVGDRWDAILPHGATGGFVYHCLKRSLDITIGALGTLAFIVALPLIALAIRLDSPGPIFYRQERVGLGGTPLRIVKFRSMVRDAESDGQAVWAVRGDRRVTRVGRFLRATHLDELPQFVGVLKGEMSLVGPRPERPAFVAQLQEQIPFYRARLRVKPGLTGWAQVMHRYGNSVDDALAKLQYDLYYIKHQSLMLDLHILAKTVGVMLKRDGI